MTTKKLENAENNKLKCFKIRSDRYVMGIGAQSGDQKMANQRKRGAQPKNQNAKKENPKNAQFGGRCTTEEKNRWTEKAKKSGFGDDLNGWIRDTLNKG